MEIAQAASRSRPLRRRLPRMERPARVRIRRRNPWVLCRRRLFGWKVRLLTGSLRDLRLKRSTTARRPTVTCSSLFTGAPACAGGRTAPRYARGSERVKRPGRLGANPAPALSRRAVDNWLLVPSRRCYGHPTHMVVGQPKLSPDVILSALSAQVTGCGQACG